MRTLVLFISIFTSGSTMPMWHGIDDNTVVRYDIYRTDKRLNEQVSEWGKSLIEFDVHVRLVIRGDYETISAVSLNTFMESTELSYYILQSNSVE
jgi:hypothetical protein